VVTAVAVKPYREITPEGKMILNLHPGQTRAWLSKARFTAAIAGRQSGKTEFEPDWLHREIQTRGEGDYIVGSASFPLLDKKLLPVMEKLFCTILKWGKYRDSDRMILSNDEKSKIFFFTGVNPEAIESATAKAAVLDECGQKQFRLGTWEAVQGRLAIHEGRALMGTTPYDFGWLKTEIHDKFVGGDKTFNVVNFESIENPMFPRAEFERLSGTMPAWKFDMFYRGRFTKPAGLIYDAFDEMRCKIKRFPIPKEWPVYSGHDFGGANPAAMFYAQVKLPIPPEAPISLRLNDFVAFEEYLPGPGYSMSQHVDKFQRIVAGRSVIKSAGGSHQEEEIRAGYRKHGWFITEPSVRDVEAGILKVYALHKTNMIFLFDDLRHYLDEILSYSRVLDEKYEPTDVIDDKSKYHLMDCERYIMSDFIPAFISDGPSTRVVRRA
jgi:hypothetical protein